MVPWREIQFCWKTGCCDQEPKIHVHRLRALQHDQGKFSPVLRIRILLICMFFDLLDPDPDPLVNGMDPDPSIIKQK